MHQTIQKIQDKLIKYPEIKFRKTDNSITILPSSETGFSVSLQTGVNACIVSFSGWHEEFSSEDDALNCFMFGLTDKCRLEVTSAGRFEYKWSLQYSKDSKWIKESEAGLLIYPFWLPRNIKYLQNKLVAGLGIKL